MKPALLLLRKFVDSDRAYLRERLAPHMDWLEPDGDSDQALLPLAEKADAALGASVSRQVLEAATRLKLIQTPGAGVEHLDLALLATRGITVCNSHSHADVVAEHALTLALALMRKIPFHDRVLKAGRWFRPASKEDVRFMSESLVGATVGLVGYGRVGQAIARLLKSFEVELLVHTRRSTPNKFFEARPVDLAALFAQANVIFVSLPLTRITRGLIGSETFAAAAKTPYLVNVGRAETIAREALLAALDGGRLGGAALDVPYGDRDAVEGFAGFLDRDDVILSAHRAGTLHGASPHLADAADNLIAFATGAPLRNRVDPDAGY